MDSILGFKYSKNVIFIASLFMGSLLSLTSSYAHEIDTSCLQFNIGHVSFKMIYVEVGESIRQSNIFISPSSYYIGQTEVTQELWEAVMGENPSLNKGNDLPVEMISWSDCQTFIARLNILTGKHFRLPTEAEWQYAAWGGNKSQGYKYSGNDSLSIVAWYNDDKTHPVARKLPNELGLYDMSGNVWEWCLDNYPSEEVKDDPSCNNIFKVIHGGSWINKDWCCQPGTRSYYLILEKSSYIGLRLAL